MHASFVLCLHCIHVYVEVMLLKAGITERVVRQTFYCLKQNVFNIYHTMCNSADDKLVILPYFSQKVGFDNSCKLHELMKPVFWIKLIKIFQNVYL